MMGGGGGGGGDNLRQGGTVYGCRGLSGGTFHGGGDRPWRDRLMHDFVLELKRLATVTIIVTIKKLIMGRLDDNNPLTDKELYFHETNSTVINPNRAELEL